MAAFHFKVAYTTDESYILPSLNAGIIDEGDLVIINKNGVGSLKFITKDRNILTFSAEVDPDQLKTAIDGAIDITLDDKITEAVDNKVNANLETTVQPIVDAAVEKAINENPSNSWENF